MGNNHWRIQGDPIQIFLNFMQFLEIFGKKCIWASPPKVGTPPYENPGSAPDNYRPLSEASEGYVFRSICLSNSERVDNTSLHPPGQGQRSQHIYPPRQHLPPSPLPGSKVTIAPSPQARVKGHNTSLPPRLCAAWRYASYWNAFLFLFVCAF